MATTHEAPTGPGVATPGPVGVPAQIGGTTGRTTETGPRPTATAAARKRNPDRRPAGGVQLLGLGSAVVYLSLIVLIPLAMVVAKSTGAGPGYFWRALTTPDAWAAFKLTLGGALLVAAINLV